MPPGSSTTPSSETNSVTTILPMRILLCPCAAVPYSNYRLINHLDEERPADRDVRGARRPDAAGDPLAPRRRRRHRQGARGTVRDHDSGRLQAPQGAGARRADHARADGAATAVAPPRHAARPGSRMARPVPPVLGRELRPPRRAPAMTDDSFRVGVAITRVFDAPRDRLWREW